MSWWDAIYTFLLVFGAALFGLAMVLLAAFLLKWIRDVRWEKRRWERLQQFYEDVERDLDPEQRRRVDLPNEDM